MIPPEQVARHLTGKTGMLLAEDLLVYVERGWISADVAQLFVEAYNQKCEPNPSLLRNLQPKQSEGQGSQSSVDPDHIVRREG